MKPASLLAALMITATSLSAQAAEKDARVFELRTYHTNPGKLDALNARFRDHTKALFEKHGIRSIGYWIPIENPEGSLIYLLSYKSREARETSWKEFAADPDWIAAKTASEVDGKLVAKVDQLFLSATDFSPDVQPSVGSGERVFELRTYTTTSPANLTILHERFRDQTMALFARHGMTNLFYFQPLPDQPAADITLVYMLAHTSEDAAKASFAAFRADPDWIAAKKASEEKGGGSLTIHDGVKSVFLKATDYSPTR